MADCAAVIDCLVDAVALVILGFGAAGGRALVEPPYADATVKVAQQKTRAAWWAARRRPTDNEGGVITCRQG